MLTSEHIIGMFTQLGIMIEVGSAGPVFLSSSKTFRDNNWRTICIEPNPIFAQKQRDAGHEIYEYACSNYNKDDISFEIVHSHNNDGVTNESFSSLEVYEEFIGGAGLNNRSQLDIEKIYVNVRTLDTILEEAGIDNVDCVFIDVEGHELNVLKGFDILKYNPKIIVVENLFRDDRYHEYMNSFNFGYHEIFNDHDQIYVRKSI